MKRPLARHIRRILLASAVAHGAPALAELPVPCGGACIQAGGPGIWVSSGSVQVPTIVGNQMTIRQTSANATLNWQTFNIGEGYGVEFQQPSATAIALNRVWDPASNPTQILGTLKANGQVYLLNRNGILFGPKAQVNVGSLLASSLDITDSALNKGLVRAFSEDRQPAFTSTQDGAGNVMNGDVSIEAGAKLQAVDGGQILIFAPNVTNNGNVSAPNGQAVLAAGNKIYLMASSDSNLRGLVVEVDVDGVSDQQLQAFLHGEIDELPLGRAANFGSIDVGTGNATLVGLAVNQSGRVSATTSVRANGTVSLRAEDHQDRIAISNGLLQPTRGGEVDIGAGSVTDILPDYADTAKTVDINAQPISMVTAVGHNIHVGANAHITATAGEVDFTAQTNPSAGESALVSAAQNDGLILIDPGAVIDVSGAEIELPADSLLLDVELRGDELKDSPMQRDGALRGKKVTVDLRKTGVLADGTPWIGTPLADLSGAVAAIQRSVGERSVSGGTIKMVSQGDVIVAPDATLNISGGRIDYDAGYLATTQLVSNGKLYDIGSADPDLVYDGIAGEFSRTSAKWGVSQTWQFPGVAASVYSPAFSEGHDAGSVVFNTPRLILDGSIDGSATTGLYQRQLANAPQSGQLVVGYQAGAALPQPNFRTGAIEVSEHSVLDDLIAAGFDPQTDVLPDGPTVIRPSLLSAEGVGRVTLLSNDTIHIGADATVSLPAGGSLAMVGSDIDVAGRIKVPSGTVQLTAEQVSGNNAVGGHDVRLDGGATIDVAGQWVNDSPMLGSAATAPIPVDGGNVSITSQSGDVDIDSGAHIDAAGGAWLQANNRVADGKGGSISLKSAIGDVTLDGQIGAEALSRGGSLSLATKALCIGAAGCAGGDNALVLAPEFFREGGFSSYGLIATTGDLVVTADADVDVRQANRVLDPGYALAPTGTSIADFSHIETLPDYLRRPASVSLTTSNFAADFRVEQGAAIAVDPGASISLTSSSRMFVDGELAAPGGALALALKWNPAEKEFNPAEAIWLGADARLSTAGVTQLQPDAQGRRIGTALDGGTVSLAADRGYVVTEQGSRIDVSGTASTLDLPDDGGGYTAHAVASNAGSVQISAAEGAFLEGELSGHAGAANALGGTLSVALNGNSRGEPPNQFGSYPDSINTYPHAPRIIDVVSDAPSDLAGVSFDTLDAAFTASHDGIARLRTSTVEQGGFDALELTTRHLLSNDTETPNQIRTPGSVNVAADLDLGRRLVIDAPTVTATADVTLSAPYVALGSTDILTQEVPAPTAADRTLTVDAGWIDLIGASALSGTDRVVLHSDGDLRLRASPNLDTSTRSLTGSFTIAGALDVEAAQVYPATLTDFTLSAIDAAGGSGSITVRKGDGTAGPVLSAGGAVRLRADHIENQGIIKAPLGTIDLDAGAGDIVLASGSVLSTSSDGQIIPFGRTEGGLDWVYDLGNTQKLVFSADLDPLPRQNIRLSAGQVQLQQGSRLDVAGGGDLQAYEFVPGIGGSRDVLAPGGPSNSYAILPALGASVAPFDQEEWTGTTLRMGATVHLDGGAGVPAGDYVLLPARYALLPGAYLITELPQYRDLPEGSHISLSNGLPVMSGRYGVADTDLVESRTRGFSVVSSTLLRDSNDPTRPAEYTLSLANHFFTTETAGARLPVDAGVVSISAGQSLDLHATLDGAVGAGGRGAALDIAADHILITPDGASTSENGVLPIAADALNGLGAESVLLGGRRSEAADGTHIDVTSQDVTLADGAVLQGPELILAAKDQVTLEANAGLRGSGLTHGTERDFIVSGDSAVVRASGGDFVDISRTGGNGTAGVIEAASGSFVAGTGAVALDAGADIHFNGDLSVGGASLLVGAPHINLGDAPSGSAGFTIGAAALNGLGADDLVLRGRQGIDFFGVPDVTVNTLTLDTPLMTGHTSDGSIAKIDAQSVTFRNSGAAASVSQAQDHGTLAVSAQTVTLGAGEYRIAGFDTVDITAAKTLLGSGEGRLDVQGDLSAAAGVVGGNAGATTTVAADGQVSLSGGGAIASLPDQAIGGALSVAASGIEVSGAVVMPSGLISLAATGAGGVTVADGAVLDASGVMRQFDTTQAFAPAGSISLTASSGDVTVASGARLSVAGARGAEGKGGDAGKISLEAPQGVVSMDGDLAGGAASGQRQGSAEIDGRNIADIDNVNASLNAAGFTDERALRVREGDVVLVNDIQAHDIDVTVDSGALTLAGTLSASGSQGGEISLAAKGDVTLNNGASIDAGASVAGGNGGTVELASRDGGVKLLAGSIVDVSGGAANGDTKAGADGELHLSVSRDVLATVLGGSQAVSLAGNVRGAADIVVEGVKSYDLGAGNATIGATQTSTTSAYYNDAAAFMQNAAALATALGHAGDADFHVRPGVELTAGGDITLASAWDLYDWRFNGEPGYLTIRAGGNLNINQNLSDGVSAAFFNFLEQPVADSWSYRLAAGADLASASPLAVKADGTGSMLLANNTLIRTGTGDIDVAAAGDVRLGNSSSVIYTIGTPVTDLDSDMRFYVEFLFLNPATLAENGGDIDIRAGRDIIGAPSDQLVTDWLWRLGTQTVGDFSPPTMWGVEFNRFRQGVGALAGGDVTLKAGRDIDNVSAVIPTTGVPLGTVSADLSFENKLDVRGGGDLSVEAGRDIGGGIYYVGRGTGELSAGGSIRAGTGWTYLGTPLHTALALGDGTFDVAARQDLTLETVFNPTLISPASQQSAMPAEWLVDFSTYAPTSGVEATSVAGDLRLNGNTDLLAGSASNTLMNDPIPVAETLGIYPPSLRASAFTGDIVSGFATGASDRQWIRMAPAAQGQLELLAAGNVRFLNNGILLSDADPALFPSPETPLTPGLADPNLGNVSLLSLLNTYGRYAYADVPVHSQAYADSVGYDGPREPLLIVAQTGDIDMSQWPARSAAQAVISAEPIKLIAGGDIIDASVAALHPEAGDVSVISAGGDIVYSVARNANRQILQQFAEVSVDGPGDLIVMAGGDVDLKASPGITTRGNTVDPALVPTGANITVMTGLGSAPDYDGFIAKYLEDDDTYGDQLAAYLAGRTVDVAADQQVAAFRGLPLEQQIPFLNQVLFSELRTSGRKAAAAGDADFSRGFDAIATLFPNADPAEHPAGDLSLFFSRIYTLAGGDIDIVAPSGTVNVGLSTPPSSFGVAKRPSDLGIVAQRTGDVDILSGGDTLVNQSRVFAADGGSILMWSSAGNIDAGRGAKSAISAPPPVITYDPSSGAVKVVYPPALTGSGIRAFVTTAGREPGDVDLYAPVGVINAGDAGIGSAGNLTLAATKVLGADNIDVGGIAVGVPVADTGGLAAGLTGASNVSSAATKATEDALGGGAGAAGGNTPLADAAFAVLDVIVLGFGDEAPADTGQSGADAQDKKRGGE